MDKLYVIKGFYNNETVYYVSIENSSHSNLPIWKVTANIENATKYSNLDIAISNCILKSIPKQNRPFVQKQLNKLDDNVMDYIGYWNEKYFRNGFCDGIELIVGSTK